MTTTLTHFPLVPHICINGSGQHWFRSWLVSYSAPSHDLNQCCVIIKWTLRKHLQWNFHQNIQLFIHEKAYENIFCEMVAILPMGRWVNLSVPGYAMWYHETQSGNGTKSLSTMKGTSVRSCGIHLRMPLSTDMDRKQSPMETDLPQAYWVTYFSQNEMMVILQVVTSKAFAF